MFATCRLPAACSALINTRDELTKMKRKRERGGESREGEGRGREGKRGKERRAWEERGDG